MDLRTHVHTKIWIPHPCVDSVGLYVTPRTEGLLQQKIISLARRNFRAAFDSSPRRASRG